MFHPNTLAQPPLPYAPQRPLRASRRTPSIAITYCEYNAHTHQQRWGIWAFTIWTLATMISLWQS
ncbi:MAG: hypothetical protein HEQ32_02750 [Vampirovibrio sp.]